MTFVPDLRGRISPVPDPDARGAWFGLAADSTRATLYRAVLEGLAFEARLTVDDLAALPGLRPIEQIRAIGGNTRNPPADADQGLGLRPADRRAEMAEATALGAALLGGLAAGVFPSLSDALARPHRRRRQRSRPSPTGSARYDAPLPRLYRPAYAALRPLHHAVREVDLQPAGSVDRLEIELQPIAAAIQVLLHLEHDLGGRRGALIGPGLQPLAHRELERLALVPVAREPDRLASGRRRWSLLSASNLASAPSRLSARNGPAGADVAGARPGLALDRAALGAGQGLAAEPAVGRDPGSRAACAKPSGSAASTPASTSQSSRSAGARRHAAAGPRPTVGRRRLATGAAGCGAGAA